LLNEPFDELILQGAFIRSTLLGLSRRSRRNTFCVPMPQLLMESGSKAIQGFVVVVVVVVV
jgi:hypothetical protein